MKRLVLAALLISATASAHKPSDAHVQLAIANDRVTGVVAVALRDLDGALDLDANGDGAITWREAQAAGPRIAAYTTERLVLTGDDGTCKLALGGGALSDYSDGAYWAMPVSGTCAGSALSLRYALLFDIDAQHRGIVQIRTPRGSSTTVVRDATPIALSVGDGGFVGGALAGGSFVLASLAALACLALLIIPALRDRRAIRSSIASFVIGSAAITLVASTGLLGLPARWIALGAILSVVIAAASNFIRRDPARWDLAFELGLVHGMGASVALAAIAPMHRATIVGFVGGAAITQLALALAITGVLTLTRRALAKRPIVWTLSGASAVAAVIWAIVL